MIDKEKIRSAILNGLIDTPHTIDDRKAIFYQDKSTDNGVLRQILDKIETRVLQALEAQSEQQETQT